MLGGMTTGNRGRTRARDRQAPGLAAFAGLIADETQAACLLALLDGRAWTAGELARHAGVAPSTLSEHLGKLVAGGLLAEERQGRHRYVRLAGARVAQLVEDLAAQTAPDPAALRPRTLRESSAGGAMARERTCYDHLAWGHLPRPSGSGGGSASPSPTRWRRADCCAGTRVSRSRTRACGGSTPPASRSTAGAAAHWPVPASTGPSAATISRAWRARPCAGTPWTRAGAYASAPSVP